MSCIPAIWQFLGDEVRTRIAMGMREIHGYRTLMESDDNYLRMAPYQYGKKNTPWKRTRAEAKGGYSHEMHKLCLPWMDGLIVSTDYLANVYEHLNDEIYVCPNSVDPADWEFEREPHDKFRIVYYGSTSHREDAPRVTRALRWAAEQPGVEVHLAGFTNPAWSFPHTVAPWQNNLRDVRRSLFKYDLGIAPLKANVWSNAKSDVKALEYAMAGVMPMLEGTPSRTPRGSTSPTSSPRPTHPPTAGQCAHL